MSGAAPRGSTLRYPVQAVNIVNIDTVEDLLADILASEEGSRETGLVTAATTTTITDSTKSWPTNVFAGALFEIAFGGVKYMRKVVSNTATVLTLDAALPSAPPTNTLYWVAPDILGRLRDVITILGEVQSTPTANTVLARLKAVNDTLLAGISVSGRVDVDNFPSEFGIPVSQFGEVQASPTVNTLLGRLKALEDGLAATAPAKDAFVITPDNSAVQVASAIYVGTGGDIAVRTSAGTDVTFLNVLGGTVVPIQVNRVYLTGTDADDMVGLV